MRTNGLNSWRQAGVLHLWRYTENVKNYPGWHLATNQAGYISFLDLLSCLRTTTDPGVLRTIKSTVPSPQVLAIANNRRSPVVSPPRIRVATSEVADEWVIAETERDVTIKLGAVHLDGIMRWLSAPDSAFDTTYGGEPPLWFWGVVEPKSPSGGKHRAG